MDEMNEKNNLSRTFSILDAPQKNDFLRGEKDKMIVPTMLP
jgi:hypothetical protein